MRQSIGQLWRWTAVVLGTGFGLGFSPVMPGTVGSVWGPPLVWWVQQHDFPRLLNVLLALVLILVGVPICAEAARYFDRKDPGAVVIDEIAAFPIVFFFVEVNLTTGILGFFWFRVFDILKPWPVRRLERLPGGVGVMADDLAAGVYAGVVLWVNVYLLNF